MMTLSYNNQQPMLPKPKDYISNKKQLSDYECVVCFDVTTDLVRCRGPCKKPLCIECISKIKTQSKRCPNRCSQQLSVQNIAHPQLSFMCPFNSQLCRIVINSQEQFYRHIQKCQFADHSLRLQAKYRRKFKCPKNHSLHFINEQNYKQIFKTSLQHSSLKCSICKQISFGDAVCLICSSQKCKPANNYFCGKCRPPPCSKSQCPIGHKFVVDNTNIKKRICDLCGILTWRLDGEVYADRKCNFDVCLRCYKNLPETNVMIPINNQIVKEFDEQDIELNKSQSKVKRLHGYNLRNRNKKIKKGFRYINNERKCDVKKDSSQEGNQGPCIQNQDIVFNIKGEENQVKIQKHVGNKEDEVHIEEDWYNYECKNNYNDK